MADLRSPNEFMAAAKSEMLDGNEPATTTDWTLILNFLALNIAEEAGVQALMLFTVLYPFPSSLRDERIVQEIWDFQKESA